MKSTIFVLIFFFGFLNQTTSQTEPNAQKLNVGVIFPNFYMTRSQLYYRVHRKTLNISSQSIVDDTNTTFLPIVAESKRKKRKIDVVGYNNETIRFNLIPALADSLYTFDITSNGSLKLLYNGLGISPNITLLKARLAMGTSSFDVETGVTLGALVGYQTGRVEIVNGLERTASLTVGGFAGPSTVRVINVESDGSTEESNETV